MTEDCPVYRSRSDKWKKSRILCTFRGMGIKIARKSNRVAKWEDTASSASGMHPDVDVCDLVLHRKTANYSPAVLKERSVSCSPNEEDALYGLLHRSQSSPLAMLDNSRKLDWLRSDLIGSDRIISTPFGRRNLVYADHAASGRSLFFIESFITHHVLPFYGNTHTEDSFVGRKTSMMMRQAGEYIKEKLGGNEDDALLMCGWGCTAAIKRLQEVMGVAVPSILRGQVLEMVQQERWLVFVGPYEHHSNLLSWRQSLAEVVEIPLSKDGMIDVERLEEHLQAAQAMGRRRMLGSFSACSNVTGLLTDTRAIATLLHKYGAFVCFDFAAGAAHVDLKMRSTSKDWFDAVVMSPHKLLGGPGAPGLLLMKKELYSLGKHPPSTCGGGTVAYVNGFAEKDTLYYEKIEEREEGGTPPIIGKVKCAMALWLRDAMGTSMIRQREMQIVRQAMKRLSTHPNIRVLGGGSHPTHKLAPIFSFLIFTASTRRSSSYLVAKPLHGRFVAKLLNDLFGIQTRGGCACAGPYGHILLGISKELSLLIRDSIQRGYEGLKPGWARLSLCYSMSDEEVNYILSAVEFLASYGARFLALYDFDWRSGNWTISKEMAEGLLKGGPASQYESPQYKITGNHKQGEQFRHHLWSAINLARTLPRCAPRRPVPSDVNLDLIFFKI